MLKTRDFAALFIQGLDALASTRLALEPLQRDEVDIAGKLRRHGVKISGNKFIPHLQSNCKY
jgi:hypothetical protein